MSSERENYAEKLKPCPFCGRNDVELMADPYYAWCRRCGAEGPVSDFVDIAADRWNTRPAAAAEQAPEVECTPEMVEETEALIHRLHRERERRLGRACAHPKGEGGHCDAPMPCGEHAPNHAAAEQAVTVMCIETHACVYCADCNLVQAFPLNTSVTRWRCFKCCCNELVYTAGTPESDTPLAAPAVAENAPAPEPASGGEVARWLCGENFLEGGVMLRCRRLRGHESGECRASRDENEQGVLDAFVKAERATRETRKAEVAGEHPAPVAEAALREVACDTCNDVITVQGATCGNCTGGHPAPVAEALPDVHKLAAVIGNVTMTGWADLPYERMAELVNAAIRVRALLGGRP